MTVKLPVSVMPRVPPSTFGQTYRVSLMPQMAFTETSARRGMHSHTTTVCHEKVIHTTACIRHVTIRHSNTSRSACDPISIRSTTIPPSAHLFIVFTVASEIVSQPCNKVLPHRECRSGWCLGLSPELYYLLPTSRFFPYLPTTNPTNINYIYLQYAWLCHCAHSSTPRRKIALFARPILTRFKLNLIVYIFYITFARMLDFTLHAKSRKFSRRSYITQTRGSLLIPIWR